MKTTLSTRFFRNFHKLIKISEWQSEFTHELSHLSRRMIVVECEAGNVISRHMRKSFFPEICRRRELRRSQVSPEEVEAHLQQIWHLLERFCIRDHSHSGEQGLISWWIPRYTAEFRNHMMEKGGAYD